MTSKTKHDTIPGSVLNDKWLFLKPVGWPKLKKRINKLHERVTRVVANSESEQRRSMAKVQSEELTSINNSRNIPSNATIRKEYVRCGKSDCDIKHGPYYYSYWKDDSGKLKKKYIGKYRTSIDKRKSRDNDCDANDTVSILSNSTEDV